MRIEYNGSNGAQIIAAMEEARSIKAKTQIPPRMEVLEISPNFAGSVLSIDVVYPDHDSRAPDRWRVPIGYNIDTETGEVTDADGVPQDYETLLQVS